MNDFLDYNIDSSTEDFELGSEATGYSEDASLDSLTDTSSLFPPMNDDIGLQYNRLSTIDNISFKGHLEDLYNPTINQARNDFGYHMSKVEDSYTLADLNYHLDNAKEAKQSEDFFQECLAEARREHSIHEAHLESITKPAEIADRYQKEIEDILNPSSSKVSFGSNLSNM